MSSESTNKLQNNFLREIIAGHVKAGTYGGRVATRFPPEPNGYPHLGHACTICLNFGLAEDFGGACNLRYDDTNPETESLEFVAAMEDAVRWLGYEPANIYFASDYFEQFYEWAVELVKKGLAYVDSQSSEEIRANRGTVTEPGVNSPYRSRPVEESLRLLDEMRRGEHPDGSHVLRAKIDMADDNMLLRDPLMYRIRRDAHHYRRGDEWNIYPLYDWAHGQGDAVENITHSVCTLEFDVHRPLYNWFLDAIGIDEPRNHQYEFARFNLDYTVMSKRKLLRLVEEGHVRGWDDPRMPTIAGQRRRGVRPEAIRSFFDRIGITRVDSSTGMAEYEHSIRDDLNHVAPRVMAVTRPLKLVIENLPEDETTWIDAHYWPHDITPPEGAPTSRRVPLTRELWIERDDFAENPPKGWKRLSPGEKVRLRHGPIVKFSSVERDEAGEAQAVHVEANPDESPGKVKGVIHWVSAEHALPAQFRLYNRLFTDPHPDEQEDFLTVLNPDSLVETEGFVEPSVAEDPSNDRYQFERLGYFWQDPVDSKPDSLVFNRIVALRGKDDHVLTAKGGYTQPVSRKGSITIEPPKEPRDPAARLSDTQRTHFDGLVGRGVGKEEAAVLSADDALRALFEFVLGGYDSPRDIATLLVHDVRRALGGHSATSSMATGNSLAEVLRMVGDGTLTRTGAGEVVRTLVEKGGDAASIVEARGLAAVRDDAALAPFVDAVITENPEEAERFRDGEERLMGFFMGQVMRRAGKGADAKAVQKLLRERLGQ
ncbi:MAG: glutamine--tRNA ligase/YqeY domain fusion protein [Bacteroidetes bacterium]|nr:glutamine--tRNA ligase/YqeY domain fusion protein [Bacteroidota bacterium]